MGAGRAAPARGLCGRCERDHGTRGRLTRGDAGSGAGRRRDPGETDFALDRL